MNKVTTAKVGAYAIAGIAAVSSYGHQVHLLSLADLDPLFGIIPSEWVTPITVDALAIIALMVRTSDTVTAATRKLALLPLILAGSLSIAANVAMATNLIQVVVGVWTVLAYIVAELFVAKMERKAEIDPAEVADAELRALRSARAKKGAETRKRNAAKKVKVVRTPRAPKAARPLDASPVSPGAVPFAELDADLAR